MGNGVTFGKIKGVFGGSKNADGEEVVSIPQDQDRAARELRPQTTRYTRIDGSPVPESFDVRGEREDAKLSVRELAVRANLPVALIERWERGEGQPSPDHQAQILAAVEGEL